MASSIINQQILKVLDQTGKRVSVLRDRKRDARAPGKRVSATGNIYWESRRNRTDKLGSNL